MLAVASPAGAAAALALPAVLGKAVDALVSGGGTFGWLVLAAGLVLLDVACDLVDAYASTAWAAGATAWLRLRLVGHLLAIGSREARPPGLRDTGDLVGRVSGNAAEAGQAGPALMASVTGALPPLGGLVLLAVIDLRLAAAFLTGLLLVALVLLAFTRNTTEVMVAYQQTQGRIAARLAESLSGARTIAAAGTLAAELQRVLEPLPALRAHSVRTWQVLARSGAQGAVAGPLALVSVLVAGGLLLAGGRISPGALFAASQYAALGAGLGGLTGVLGRLARSRAGIRRAAEVLAVPPPVHGTRSLPKLRPGCGRLEFRSVTVRSGDTVLLDGVNLTVPGGTAVAVVGWSGSGKSVLAAVAARLHDPDAGEVRLDGVPLAALSRSTLRTAVGCAFARPALVGATVGDAIGLGLSEERVRSAAAATHVHEFVSRLPRGYDTPLAEAAMSGGEAQRLGIARAWHAERLLVLDDATSSLDMVTEMRIGRTLTEAPSPGGVPRTRLIVTHRAATAARADLVVWLDAGRVRGLGTHARLWALEPAYREVFA